jgi:hypothetical protein
MFVPTSECKIEAIQFNHFIGLQETLRTFQSNCGVSYLWNVETWWEKKPIATYGLLHIEKKAFDAWASLSTKKTCMKTCS